MSGDKIDLRPPRRRGPIEDDIDWLYEQPEPAIPLGGAGSAPDALGAPE